MGAIPHETGTTFRVWAPNAAAVAVMTSADGWQGHHPLNGEGNGYWALDVAGIGPGTEYKFVLQTAGGELVRNDPYARQVTSSDGNSVVLDPHFDWEDDAFRMPAWNELVIYELHIGTFHAPHEGQAGTFYTAIEKLDYLRDLGINAVEVMPPSEFPGDRSWGYNPAHPFTVETAYGGPMAFKEFVKQAHRRGIAVILDVVYNHFGPDHLPHWRFDGWYENEGGGIYFYNDWRAETPWGRTRPDYGRPEVRQYIRDNALYWLHDFRVDGLRTDALAFVRNVKGENDPAFDLPEGWTLVQWLHEEIRKTMPWKITIAEDLAGTDAITQPVADGGEGFAAQWHVGFAHTLRRAVTAMNDEDRDLTAVARELTFRFNNDAFQRVIYSESHDEMANGAARIPEQIMPGAADNWYPKKRATLAAALVLTAPGIPMLFQGQELLEDGEFVDTRPLNWGRLEHFHGLANLYADLIRLRRNLTGVTRGLMGQGCQVQHLNTAAKVLAFLRWADGDAPTTPGDATLVIANFSQQTFDNYTIGLPAGGTWHVRFNADWQGYDAYFGDFKSLAIEASEGETDGLPFAGSIGIGAYAVLVLSQQA